MTGRSGTADERGAMTLVEVLLVLALLLVLATITWPALEPTLAAYQLRKSADLIRAEWNRARIAALKGGQTVQFRFVPDGRDYCLERLPEPTLDPGVATAVGVALLTPTRDHIAALPEKVSFAEGTVEQEEVLPVDRSQPQAQEGWSKPIDFYPDGTTATARLTLKNQRNQRVQVSLRGLTGVVTVGNVEANQE